MKTSSRKAKGRRAAQEAREIMLEVAHCLKADDIQVTSSGATGEDLLLSPRARDIFPISVEVKCQEKLNIWSALQQAESHAQGTHWHPVVAFRKNHQPLRAIIDFRLLCLLLAENAGDGAKLS